MKTALVVFLLLTCAASGQIELEAHVGRVLPRDGMLDVSLSILIKNVSDSDIVVPTDNIGPIWSFEKTKVTVLFAARVPKRRDAPVVESVYRFMPVKLAPGEITEIRGSSTLIGDQDLSHIAIVYWISDEVADRYGFAKVEARTRTRYPMDAE